VRFPGDGNTEEEEPERASGEALPGVLTVCAQRVVVCQHLRAWR